MSSNNTITADEVKKIAKLSNLPLADSEVDLFAAQFTSTIKVIDELNQIDTTNILPTYTVTGLKNITRPDEVDQSRILSQSAALAQGKDTSNGFFVVKRVIDQN